jgi:hypothetical protein
MRLYLVLFLPRVTMLVVRYLIYMLVLFGITLITY